MAVLKSCCCFTNVRSGSLACGVYSLVLAAISCGIVAYNLYFYELTGRRSATDDAADFEINRLSQNLSFELNTLQFNDSSVHDKSALDQRSHQIFQSIFLCALVVSSLLFLTSILLMIGISTDKRHLLLPWMVIMACNIALDTGTLTYHTTIVRSLTYIIIEMVIWLLLTVLNIYCLLCVFSQYQELREGRGTREYVRHLGARIAYRPEIQQVHINQGPIIINGHLPIGVTSSIHSHRVPETGGNHVTTTLLVSAPDYNIAAGQLPQYHEATSESVPLTVSRKDEESASRRDEGSESPPPPYSS